MLMFVIDKLTFYDSHKAEVEANFDPKQKQKSLISV